MNLKNIIRTTGLALLAFCCVHAFAPEPCQARKVSVDWGVANVEAEGGEAESKAQGEPITTRADALNKAIAQATLAEAFALLPSTMSSSQKSALTKYVSAKAPTLVRGYRDEGSTVLASGQQRLVLDVNVDKQWLIDALQRLGVYYLAGHDALPCAFYYIGQSSADQKSSVYKKATNYVTLLSTAAGLQNSGVTFMTAAEFADMVNRESQANVTNGVNVNGQEGIAPTVPNASPDDAIAEALNAAKISTGASVDTSAMQEQTTPTKSKGPQALRFVLVNEGKDAWSAKLQGPDYNMEANGSSIDMVWEKLWPAYLSTRFARSGVGSDGNPNTQPDAYSDVTSLQVWGWSSADGVVALDKAMRKWYKDQGGDVKDLDLLKITMQSGAVKAIWRVDMASTKAFKAFVRDYADQRRLRFELAPMTQGFNTAL